MRVPRKFIDWWVKELAVWLRRKKVADLVQQELNVVFLPEKQAKKLNRQFRQKNKATDILSFAAIEEQSLGELVFCDEVVRRQALEHRLSLRFEIGYLLIHGVLHLLGYDHEKDPGEAEEMYRLQDAAFDFLCRKWQSRH